MFIYRSGQPPKRTITLSKVQVPSEVKPPPKEPAKAADPEAPGPGARKRPVETDDGPEKKKPRTEPPKNDEPEKSSPRLPVKSPRIETSSPFRLEAVLSELDTCLEDKAELAFISPRQFVMQTMRMLVHHLSSGQDGDCEKITKAVRAFSAAIGQDVSEENLLSGLLEVIFHTPHYMCSRVVPASLPGMLKIITEIVTDTVTAMSELERASANTLLIQASLMADKLKLNVISLMYEPRSGILPK